MSTPVDPNVILVSLIVGIPATVAAYGSMGARREATAANRAVNHRPEGEKSAIQLIEQLSDDMGVMKQDQAAARSDIRAARSELGAVSRKLDGHLAFHQSEHEKGR